MKVTSISSLRLQTDIDAFQLVNSITESDRPFMCHFHLTQPSFFFTFITPHAGTIRHAHLFNSSILKTSIASPLKRRRRAKSNATKALAIAEATMTQLPNTIGDVHFIKSTTPKTPRTNLLKRRRRAKSNAMKTLAPVEATMTQLPNTIEDAIIHCIRTDLL